MTSKLELPSNYESLLRQNGPVTIRYSIVITCYNQREFIEDALKSALSIMHSSKEVIVVDDGSQDGSVEVLQRYQEVATVLVMSTNVGASEARNRGAGVTRGEYLLFLDGDDLLTPWALDIYDRLIMERDAVIILSGARWFEGAVPALGPNDAPKRVEFVEYASLMAKDRGNSINIGAFVVRRRAFEEVGGWTTGIFHLDGQDLCAKLGYSGKAVVVCWPYTMLYRMHGANSIRCVPPWLRAAHVIMDREWAGQYPGGRSKRFERYARHGGTTVFCIRKALRAGLYMDAIWLLLRGRSMILAGLVRRATVVVRGRRPIETLRW